MSLSEADSQEQSDKYTNLLHMYVKEIPGKMFIIELTKCCNYSTFVLMYRDESLIDLYRRVSFHMGCDIISLYILTSDNKRITVPINNKTMKEFIYSQTDLNNRTMRPVYDVPLPVVYRIYLDDGHHHEHHHNHDNETFT